LVFTVVMCGGRRRHGRFGAEASRNSTRLISTILEFE
jgi:hypothetical protein